MLFESNQETLRWYESEKRVLTPAYIDALPWNSVNDHELKPMFAHVLRYMRDIEHLTTMYYEELMLTPTGRDPAVKAFMDRWVTEEPVHGELLNRFLETAGYASGKNWNVDVRKHVPKLYQLSTRLNGFIAHGFGQHFSAVHMTWGAINELSTLTGYQRLWSAAKHPFLEKLLKAIAREEARHAFFYWSAARIALQGSRFRQSLTRFLVKHFWTPVGQGAKPATDTNLVIRALFSGPDGIDVIDQRVNQRIEQLPGFEKFKLIRDWIARVVGQLA